MLPAKRQCSSPSISSLSPLTSLALILTPVSGWLSFAFLALSKHDVNK